MATLSITHSFSPSTTISSSQMNTNFGNVTTWANGNIGHDNMATLAGPFTWSVSSTNKAVVVSSAGSVSAIQVTASSTGMGFESISTTRGNIPLPKMTNAQRNAIASPTEGEMVFNTTNDRPEYYTGSAWRHKDHSTAVSASSAGYFTSSASFVLVDNLTVTLTTRGGPVKLILQSDGVNGAGDSEVNIQGSAATTGRLRFVNSTDATTSGINKMVIAGDTGADTSLSLPPSAFEWTDYGVVGSAGSKTWEFQVATGGSGTIAVVDCVLRAVEV